MESNLKEVRDDVFRKIGRNLILFQEMELMLKHIISEFSFKGYASELEENKKRKKENVNIQTMGQLIRQFTEDNFSDYKPPVADQPKREEAYFEFGLHIDCDRADYEKKTQVLKAIVEDRNRLIHHLLPDFNQASIESCFYTADYLDKQRNKLLPEYEGLKNLIIEGEKLKKILLEFSESGQLKKIFDDHDSAIAFNLLKLLGTIAFENNRPGKWTELSTAGKIIRQKMPGVLDFVKMKFHVKTLKELILAVKAFDIQEKDNPKGGTRMFYRLKPGYESMISFDNSEE